MATTLIENLREAMAKIPNFMESVQEAAKPPETVLADVAYIYNGYDDIELQHLGMYSYKLPFGEVTRIDPLPNHREIDQFNSNGREIAWRLLPMKGESIARELVETRGYTEKGMVVFTRTATVPKTVKEEADAKGLAYRLKEIERFKVGRDKARSGIAGYKLKPDDCVYRWMKLHNPDDELFGEGHRKTDSATSVAAAINLLTRLVTAESRQAPVVITSAPEGSVPTDGPVVLPPVVLPTMPQYMPPLNPRRRPLESDGDYQLRCDDFQAAAAAQYEEEQTKLQG